MNSYHHDYHHCRIESTFFFHHDNTFNSVIKGSINCFLSLPVQYPCTFMHRSTSWITLSFLIDLMETISKKTFAMNCHDEAYCVVYCSYQAYYDSCCCCLIVKTCQQSDFYVIHCAEAFILTHYFISFSLVLVPC